MSKVKAEYLNIAQLKPFEGHPFQVREDEEMDQLMWSILSQGLLTPLVVRPLENDQYEVISGHRRLLACQKAGIETVPALVYPMSRDESMVALVDSNLHREKLLPSEKAWAYRLKAEALNRQGNRSDLTLGQVVPKSDRWRTTAEIGEQTGESYKTVQRYIRLTHLIPPLIQKVDEGKIALSPGVELSYLDEEMQQLVFDAMEREDCTPSYSQTVRMRKLHREGLLTEEEINSIMSEQKANQKEQIRIPKERLDKVLPKGISGQKAEEYILKACEYYGKHMRRLRNAER